MPTIHYPTNPNTDTAFIEQDDGTKNRALMIAPQDISTLELPNNPNSTKGYITVDGKKQRVILTADITGGGGGSSLPDQTGHSGEFLTTDGTDASWAAVDALPDQTGNSGKFLTTDGTDASWSDKPLVNTATGTNSLTIAGTPATGNNATNIGGASSTVAWGTAIGRATTVTAGNGIAIGFGATAKKTYSMSIGNGIADANNAIQLSNTSNTQTNSDANTFKVGNANGNFEMMDANGNLPADRLASTTGLADGNYRLRLTMASGVPTLTWVAE